MVNRLTGCGPCNSYHQQRSLQVLVNCHDGLDIAERDLVLRGAGALFAASTSATRQSGATGQREYAYGGDQHVAAITQPRQPANFGVHVQQWGEENERSAGTHNSTTIIIIIITTATTIMGVRM
jgi:RecG-like helicase